VTINDRQAKREEFLRALYEDGDGKVMHITYGIGERIGVTDEQELLVLARRLEHDGLIAFKTTGFGISLTPAGVRCVEESFAEGSPEAERVAQKQQDRLDYLFAAFDATGGDDTKSFNFREIGHGLGWIETRSERAMEFLANEEYIEHWTMGGNMRMTMEGIKWVEDNRP